MRAMLFVTVALASAAPPPVSPGSLNPQVSQANIRVTICTPGWTKKIRPSARYIKKIKLQQLQERGWGNPAGYVEDHVEPLDLGGAPKDPDNLQPQTITDARRKDIVEWFLNREVCRLDNPMPLADAQKLMLRWNDPVIRQKATMELLETGKNWKATPKRLMEEGGGR